MPIIPTYTPGQVRQDVAPGVQTTAAAFGGQEAAMLGQAARTVGKVGDQVFNLALIQQEKTERAQVRDVLSQAQNEAADYMTNNVLTKRGQDAINVVKPTQEYLGTLKEKYGKTLTTPAQKEAFDSAFLSVFDHSSQVARNHQFREQEVYQQHTLTASKASNVATFMTDPLNGELAKQTEAMIAADNNQLYRGFPDQAKNATAIEISKMHSNAAEMIAKSDSARALQYLHENKGKIVATDFETMNDKLKTAVISDGANRQVSVLSGMDEASAMAAANKIKDDKERDLTIQGLKAHYSSVNATGMRVAADKSAALVDSLIQNPSNAAFVIPKDYPLDKRAELMASANARTISGDVTTDFSVYRNLVAQAAQDPDGFLRRDLTPYLSSLSNKDMKDVLDIRDQMSKKRKDAQTQAFQMDGVNKMFDEATQGIMGLDLRESKGKFYVKSPGALWGSSETELTGEELAARKKQIADFRAEFESRVNSELPEKKDRTTKNVRAILDDMTAEVVVKSHWFKANETVPKGLVDANPALDKSVPKSLQGLKGLKREVVEGQQYFYNYNADRTSAVIYDINGKQVGTWPAK